MEVILRGYFWFAAIMFSVTFIFCQPVVAAGQDNELRYWLPTGVLDVGKLGSEREHEYRSTGPARISVLTYVDGTTITDDYREVSGRETFTVKLRQIRGRVPDGDLVMVRRFQCEERPISIKVTVQGRERPDPWIVGSGPAGATCAESFYVIPSSEFAGKDRVEVRLETAGGSTFRSYCYRFYLTSDFRHLSPDDRALFDPALGLLLTRNWAAAKRAFDRLISKGGAVGQVASAHARYAAYQLRSCGAKLGARERYLLGLYCLENGFWEAAEQALKKATELDPNNPDAWYMLAEAQAYLHGDSGDQIESLMPLYRRAADLYKERPNVWNIYLGVFSKARTTDGIVELDQPEIDRIRKYWRWVTDLLAAASRGSLRLNSTVKVYENEFDCTRQDAFDKLWKPGEFDIFFRLYRGAVAETGGPEVGPNRTAFAQLDPTKSTWEDYLRAFNQVFVSLLMRSGNGAGVPEEACADSCGFWLQPSEGRVQASLDRYCITPGMFRSIHAYDSTQKDYLVKWLLYGPYERKAEGTQSTITIEDKTEFPAEFAVDTEKKHVPGPWIDLKKLLGPKSDDVFAYASCYVFSPLRQKVRFWLGMNDSIRVWLNGRCIYDAVYIPSGRWEEANEPNQISPVAVLERGWNSLLVKVENSPKSEKRLREIGGKENGWGFSLRICGMENESLIGLKSIPSKPGDWTGPRAAEPIGRRNYSWREVAGDYTTLLPRLTKQDLVAWTGLPDISISPEGLITSSGPRTDQPWLEEYEPEDRALNNELNSRTGEAVAVFRYLTKKKRPRDLVFMRPSASDTYTALMKPGKLLGYVLIGASPGFPNGRAMLVVDTYLGPRLPSDERDLLRP